MARVIRDRGRQVGITSDFWVWDLDCGCEVRIDQRAVRDRINLDFRTLLDFGTLVNNAAVAHDCDVVVQHSPRPRTSEYAYMGVPSLREWWEPLHSRPSVLPGEAPEEVLRRATERLRGASAGMIVDEMLSPVPVQTTVGFKQPPKPPEPPKPKDRFELIELD